MSEQNDGAVPPDEKPYTEDEILAALREMREKGGQELSEFLPELEQMVRGGE